MGKRKIVAPAIAPSRSRFRLVVGALLVWAIASSVAAYLYYGESELHRTAATALRNEAKNTRVEIERTQSEMKRLREAFAGLGENAESPAVKELRAILDGPEEGVSLTRAHFLVAAGIPDFLGLDIAQASAEIQKIADNVKVETDRNFAQHRAKNFQESRGREEEYKLDMLATVLRDDFKIRYVQGQPDHRKPETQFVNGLLRTKTGTCVSMPILYVLVGERLGYPIHLVAIKDHYFCRWDDGKYASNIEATSGGGIADDAKYIADFKLTEAEVSGGFWMKNLTKKQVVAQFLAARATYWLEQGKRPQALADYRLAASYCSADPYIIANLARMSEPPKASARPVHPATVDPLYYTRQTPQFAPRPPTPMQPQEFGRNWRGP